MVTTRIVLLLCFCPAVCVMCPNNLVVVFQPRTGTAPYLGSVANYTFYYNPPAPPVSTNFLDIFNVTLCPITPPWVFFLLVDPLSCTYSQIPLLVWSTFQMSVARPLHLSSFAACLCTLFRKSAYSAVSHECVPPPFAALGLLLSSWCKMFWDLLRTYCPLIFGQWKWIMMYGFTIWSPIFSLEYLLLRYGQGKGLNQCQKTGVTFIFGLVQHMFWGEKMYKPILRIPKCSTRIQIGVSMGLINMHSTQVG